MICCLYHRVALSSTSRICERCLKDYVCLSSALTETDKCVFARDEVKYLGHVITQEGVLPDNDKVRAVLEMKTPSSLRHLRTFLQTCSWFRKFIPNFSNIAEPLISIT
ncbi:unnamed protein product [Euphydryas editha]|uniref:Reverse transcriptase n=1 Tax=Euphydryas editha TaxID=104508 RepID=A0AAU9TSW1_EUPED|nr:unnamed protein product [Euphydryas editha]